MLNITKFVQIRKSLKLSQTELCTGICTQSTLSKFENNGLVPSFKILNQLCERMNISISDLMISDEDEGITDKLIDASFSLVSFDYDTLSSSLNKIKKAQLKKDNDKNLYNYLKGQLALHKDNEPMTALYHFNSILTSINLDKDSLYRLLALNGCSEVYASQDEIDKAKHYYDQIQEAILTLKIKRTDQAILVLSILCTSGEFYGKQQFYKQSDRLLKAAYNICAKRHMVYYLARVTYRLAQNLKEQNGDSKKIKTYLEDTVAFGRLNGNIALVEKAQKELDL